MNYKINTGAGDSFTTVAKDAKELATRKNFTCEFDFNGVICVVNANTNLDWLYRDYSNSWTMGWKTVGPDCVAEYDEETKKEMKRLNDLNDEKQAEQTRQYKIKEDNERAAFKENVKGLEMELLNGDDWAKGKSKNTDSYGACIYEYAEGWALLMQREILDGKKLQDVAEKTSHEMGFLGITGYMYGAAVSILSHCWKHGETLRKWHNKEYNHEGDGVVNPALLTISQP